MRKLLLAAAVAALAVPALAQPAPGGPPPEGHGGHGRPHDGGPRHARLFISPSGEPFRGEDGLAAWFAGADADHDGAITAAEFQADAERAFRLYDLNGDGRIDGFEVQAYERERAPEITEIGVPGEEGGPRSPGGMGGRRGGGHGGGHGGWRRGGETSETQGAADAQAQPHMRGAGRDGAARFSLLNEPEPLLAADEDVDGRITHAEWLHATARRFALLDHGHTGRLTLDGLRGAIPKSQQNTTQH